MIELHEPADAEIVARLQGKEPAVFRNGARDWPARTWSWAHLEVLGRGVTVKCEIGDAMQGTNSHSVMTLAEYVAGVAHGQLDSKSYLSQFDVLKALPQLEDDLRLSLLPKRFGKTLAWIGCAGTFTGLHCDHADNLVAQLVGRKRFTLAAPTACELVYVSKKYDYFTDCSVVDARQPDLNRHPRLAEVQWSSVELGPGDMLFTPAGWWHYVEALEASVTVNRFGLNVAEAAGCSWQFIREALHRAGLYRRNWCTCHGRGPAR